MNIRDLVPWNRGRREVGRRRENGDPLLALQSGFDRAFEDFWRTLDAAPAGWDTLPLGVATPQVDVRETDEEVEVVAELPGMDEKDVEVRVAEGALVIRGEKSSEREADEKGYILRERSFGHVERLVPLPEGLDLDEAKARFKKGVLEITIPKTPEARASVKRIAVQRS
jgi:HSP20 family protein